MYAGENIVIVVHMHRVGVLVHYESIKSTCKEQAILLAALPMLRVLSHLVGFLLIYDTFSPEGSQGVVGGLF